MSRALLTLLAGILLAVLLAAVIAGGARDLATVLGPVLVTTALGIAVLAVVAHRARLKERSEQLQDTAGHGADDVTEDESPASVPDEETDRG